MFMRDYLSGIKPIPISRTRRKQKNDKVTPQEATTYKSLSVSLLWIGCSTLPQATYAASCLQQKLASQKWST